MAGVRRTWDKEYYAQKAQERIEFGDDFVDQDKEGSSSTANKTKVVKNEMKSAESDEEGPTGTNKAFIKARDYKLELDNKAGKVEVINPLAEDSAKAGFWCDVCKCLSKDSFSYLDHINGKKHQAALGFSMRVERADIDAVKQRLEALKRKAGGGKNSVEVPRLSAMEEQQQRLAKEEEERQEFKRRRKEERKTNNGGNNSSIHNNISSSNAVKIVGSEDNSERNGEENNEEENDELEQMLGFKGFGSKKK